MSNHRSRRFLAIVAIGLAATLGLVACGDDDEAPASGGDVDASDEGATDAESDEPAGTDDGSDDGSDDGEAAPPSGELDMCALFSPEDFVAVTGITDANQDVIPASGSNLGMCTYTSLDGAITVAARPAREWEGTIDFYDDLEAVDGTPHDAYFAESVGLLALVEGQSFMFQIMAMNPDLEWDLDLSLEVLAIAVGNL